MSRARHNLKFDNSDYQDTNDVLDADFSLKDRRTNGKRARAELPNEVQEKEKKEAKRKYALGYKHARFDYQKPYDYYHTYTKDQQMNYDRGYNHTFRPRGNDQEKELKIGENVGSTDASRGHSFSDRRIHRKYINFYSHLKNYQKFYEGYKTGYEKYASRVGSQAWLLNQQEKHFDESKVSKMGMFSRKNQLRPITISKQMEEEVIRCLNDMEAAKNNKIR